MLTLTRYLGESIILLDGQIEIKILGRHHNVIRLGIKAPKHISIDREEIFIKKTQETKGIN